jgi:hypothetical protein
LAIPFGNPDRDPFLPTLLVNPGLEQVKLARTESGRYRAATVEQYHLFGLLRPAPFPPRGTKNLLGAWLTVDRLVVRCGDMLWIHPVAGADPLARAIEERGEVVLGISTAVDPGAVMTNPEPVKRILAAGDLATVLVPLMRHEPVPNPNRPTVMSKPDPALADEQNEADWLPITRFRKPTYDPATGLFEVGMGMDGPMHWRLTNRGVGLANGLIAGPAGSGKSNVVRLVVVEALCSDLFDIAVADPLDRNGWAGLLAQYATRTAVTQLATVDLLRWVVGQVGSRLDEADLWRLPGSNHPGLLIVVDDAHVVLRDPAAADLAAKIALDGPGVSIGLVAVLESVNPNTVAGRLDLMTALGRTNALLFDKRELELWESLQRG